MINWAFCRHISFETVEMVAAIYRVVEVPSHCLARTFWSGCIAGRWRIRTKERGSADAIEIIYDDGEPVDRHAWAIFSVVWLCVCGSVIIYITWLQSMRYLFV